MEKYIIKAEIGERKIQGLVKSVTKNCALNNSAYKMLHQIQFVEPCLSFDIIDNCLAKSINDNVDSVHIVAGTQASRSNENKLFVAKILGLSPVDNKSLKEPWNSSNKRQGNLKVAVTSVVHQGCVNRVRTANICGRNIAASWSELGTVSLWNLNDMLENFNETSMHNSVEHIPSSPLFCFHGHQSEGFAIDWNNVSKAVLATGDCRHAIHIWQPAEAGKWIVDQRPLMGHAGSVEDLQWSPNEKSVLASCSVDKSIRIWDCRVAPSKSCMLSCLKAHQADVNVIAWNRYEPFLVSGGDDGILNVWDLRKFRTCKPVASFKHHTNYVSTVEWHPIDSSVFSSGSADDQIAIWDLAIENDSDINFVKQCATNLPPQLLFIHQGQQNVKELHWYKNVPGVILSTAHNGFNLFQTISV